MNASSNSVRCGVSVRYFRQSIAAMSLIDEDEVIVAGDAAVAVLVDMLLSALGAAVSSEDLVPPRRLVGIYVRE